MWRSAIGAGADIVTVTSYNEWHEGTQIEPARRADLATRATRAPGASRVAQRRAPYLERTSYWAAASHPCVPDARPLWGGGAGTTVESVLIGREPDCARIDELLEPRAARTSGRSDSRRGRDRQDIAARVRSRARPRHDHRPRAWNRVRSRASVFGAAGAAAPAVRAPAGAAAQSGGRPEERARPRPARGARPVHHRRRDAQHARERSRRPPLLVVVDDAQWLDAATP